MQSVYEDSELGAPALGTIGSILGSCIRAVGAAVNISGKATKQMAPIYGRTCALLEGLMVVQTASL